MNQALSTSCHHLPLSPVQMPETIYRRFFIAGILVILSAGALWGAYLLYQVGQAGSFTGVSIFAINAHGHAQIFGWVGLFIMGFAYQAFPRMWGTRLVGPHLAVSAFVIMIVSIALSTASLATAQSWSFAVPSGIVGGVLQVAAVLIFVGQMIITLRRSSEPHSPAVGFMVAAMIWFVLMSIMNAWHSLALMQADSRETLLAQIATYQAALRDMQIHGLALCMILGVSMRFFPGMFGLAKTGTTRGWWALGLIQFAIVAEITLLISSRVFDKIALAGALILPWVMLTIGVALVVLPWRLWRPLPLASRSTKFVRAAYLWLGISLTLLLLVAPYTLLREMEFSHAYYGAMRHAITVGFISMMILGISSHVVPVLNGADQRTLSGLWVPFLLVNAGCALRVSAQILTDWSSGAFSIIAFSGAMEVTGIAWWAVGLLVIMCKAPQTVPLAPRADAVPRVAATSQATSNTEVPISLDTPIRDLARAYPNLQPILASYGLDTCCMGEKTVREAATLQTLSPDHLLKSLQVHDTTCC